MSVFFENHFSLRHNLQLSPIISSRLNLHLLICLLFLFLSVDPWQHLTPPPTISDWFPISARLRIPVSKAPGGERKAPYLFGFSPPTLFWTHFENFEFAILAGNFWNFNFPIFLFFPIDSWDLIFLGFSEKFFIPQLINSLSFYRFYTFPPLLNRTSPSFFEFSNSIFIDFPFFLVFQSIIILLSFFPCTMLIT